MNLRNTVFAKGFTLWILMLLMTISLEAQHEHHSEEPIMNIVEGVEIQPLLAQAIRLEEALGFLGSALSEEDSKRLKALQDMPYSEEVSRIIQEILDPYTLFLVDINPEARVKVFRGMAKSNLKQAGWSSFLVKVHNQSGSTAKLEIESPNAEPALHQSSGMTRMQPQNSISSGQLENRFLELSMYRNRPLKEHLSGLKLEYAVVQIFSKDSGKREVQIGFNIGQGTQDIGFRNTIDLLFDIKPSVKVNFKVEDVDGAPTMASFVIKDGIERQLDDRDNNASWIFSDGSWSQNENYRKILAHTEFRYLSKELTGVYPLPSRRVAATDEYPDFFFQPQIYRQDGEHVYLSPGTYDIKYMKGPEYEPQHKELTIPEGVDTIDVTFKLKRWVNLGELNWYSSDHHIHASGCSHYESPSQGVDPDHMLRQIKGEGLNFGGALTWGPGWYYQKQFFTGDVHSLSTDENVIRYDVEVSGFPSSHGGHLSLLNLKEDDYPNTTTIEEWPSWTLPVLKWAKSQGGMSGYSHSGIGLEPIVRTEEPFNYEVPKMDGIGANEYIVVIAVAPNTLDFYAMGNTPAPWETNMWYQTLNLGYTTRLSGESDFPCVYDERVGIVRSYSHLKDGFSYDNLLDGIIKGRSYVTDGFSHIIDFSVNDVEMGVGDSKLSIANPGKVKIKAKAIANLPEVQTEHGATIAASSIMHQPHWHLERARIGKTRDVRVGLIVNGKEVASQDIEANANWTDVEFDYEIEHSSWVALRIYPSSHTNPVFVIVDDKPIISKLSAQWAQKAVDQAWKMKSPNIRESEREEAEKIYMEAKSIFAEKEKQALHD